MRVSEFQLSELVLFLWSAKQALLRKLIIFYRSQAQMSHPRVAGNRSGLRVLGLKAQQILEERRAVPGESLANDRHGRRLSEHQGRGDHRLAHVAVREPVAEPTGRRRATPPIRNKAITLTS